MLLTKTKETSRIQLVGHELNFVLSKKKLLIGSSEKCDIIIKDQKISSYHAMLILNNDGGAKLIDLDSNNGSFINNEKVEINRDYSEGMLIGKFTEYHMNGNLYQEGNYVEGELDGKWKTYYDNKVLASESEYKTGKRVGEYKKYDSAYIWLDSAQIKFKQINDVSSVASVEVLRFTFLSGTASG